MLSAQGMTFEMDLYLARVPSPVIGARLGASGSRSSSRLVSLDMATLAHANGVPSGEAGTRSRGSSSSSELQESREDARLHLPPGFRCLYVEDDVELQYTLPQVGARARVPVCTHHTAGMQFSR